jgi:diguanylate cyclase (GGDEF)-like protein
MTPHREKILIRIEDTPERKRVLGLLEQAGYPYILSKSEKDLNDKAVRLVIAADLSSPEWMDSNTYRLILTDRFASLRLQNLEDLSVNWIKRPFSDGEFLAQVKRSLKRQSEESAHIRRKRRLERLTLRLEDLAVTDPLTGLYNLRYFQHQLQKEVQRAKRYGTPVSLILIDLDHFKAVNDQYGHPAGDEVLRTLGAFFQKNLRTLDVSVRYGGDEFAIILPNTSKQSAVAAADKLKQQLFRIEKNLTIQSSIRFSTGVAEAPADTEDEAELVRLADGVLYQNKKQIQD